nr:unnamed protein product [Digitaria exilis]
MQIETILMLMNGYDLAPQSTRPTPTPLPIVVPQDFDRTAAVSRYREKRKSMLKFDVKADYSIRRESSENLVAAATALWRQIECCANCGESSEATPMMRQGPNGYKTFCNACGLMWAKTGKIRKLADPEGGEAESRAGRRVHDGAAGLVKVERLD